MFKHILMLLALVVTFVAATPAPLLDDDTPPVEAKQCVPGAYVGIGGEQCTKPCSQPWPTCQQYVNVCVKRTDATCTGEPGVCKITSATVTRFQSTCKSQRCNDITKKECLWVASTVSCGSGTVRECN